MRKSEAEVILGILYKGYTAENVKEAFNFLAKAAHDNGSFDRDMGRLTKAKEILLASLKQDDSCRFCGGTGIQYHGIVAIRCNRCD